MNLPIVTVQHTFPEVIQEVFDGILPSESFWVSCYKTSEPSVHSRIQAELDEVKRDLVNLTPTDGSVEMSETSDGAYSVSCKPLNILPTKIVIPGQNYFDPERSNPRRPQKITAFDVAPDSSRFATGFLDGSVFIYPSKPYAPTSTQKQTQSFNMTNSKISSKPHVSSVSSLKFFPSCRVLLSAGADFILTILSAEFPEEPNATRVSPVRTFRGHTRAVTSAAIIAEGRNLLSSSLDSTVKLWDVPSKSIVNSLQTSSLVLSTSLGERMPVPPDGEEVVLPDSEDVRDRPETRSKIVFCGLQNGSFELFDLGSKASIYTSTVPSPHDGLTSISYSHTHNLLSTGSSKGIVTLYDTRLLGTPLTSFSRSGASIEDLEFTHRDSVITTNSGTTQARHEAGLAIATSDGLPYVASIIPEGPEVGAELIGSDCDPVRHVRVRGKGSADDATEIWSASDDAIVRRYFL